MQTVGGLKVISRAGIFRRRPVPRSHGLGKFIKFEDRICKLELLRAGVRLGIPKERGFFWYGAWNKANIWRIGGDVTVDGAVNH